MLKWLFTAALVLLLGWLLIPYLESDESQVLRHHQRLIQAIHQNDTPTLLTLLDETVAVQEFTSREEVLATLGEKHAIFRAYQFEYGQPHFLPQSTETEKPLSQTVHVLPKANSPFPPPVNVPSKPWIFIWVKASSGIGKWKLSRVTNDEFAL